MFLVRKKDDGQLFAMKVINKSQAIAEQGMLLKRELELFRKSMVHPLVVKLYFSFPSEKSYHLVMEYISGENLYQRIKL